MGVVRRFAVAGLDEAAARSGRRRGLVIGALDETGQCKSGRATAGVKRQYLGCAGRVANGINTVHLSYVREMTGHALIGARQWIPAGQISDPAASAVMGLPADLVFRTKGQLAIDICTDTFTDGVGFDFLCGDEVYGNCTELREFCEGHGQGYVLRVRSTFHLVLAGGGAAVTRAQAARAPGRSKRRSARLRRPRRLPARPHQHPGASTGPARPAAASRPGNDPAHRPGDRPPPHPATSHTTRPRRTLGELAPSPPGPRTLVPLPHTARARNREPAGQLDHEDRLEPRNTRVRPTDVRISLIGLPVAAVCLAGFPAASSGQNPPPGPLTGHLHGVGGPAPGLPRPWPGTVTPTRPGVHRDVPIGASGTYSVVVPAGRYTVVGHSPLYGSGAGLCQATGVATVTSGHATKADVLCQMK